MRGLERVGRLGWRWVALFAALVVLPAIALTLLSIRAFQGEASRAAFQRRERQQQVLRLLENDLRDWFLSLDREKQASGIVEIFEVRDSRVFLPRLNVFLSPGHGRATEVRPSDRALALWRQAQAAEAAIASLGADAISAYRNLLSQRPPLPPWARIALLRLSLQRRNCTDAAALLAAIRQKDGAAVTESGIPVWVAASLLSKDAGGGCPSPLAAQLLADAQTELQRGRWPLTAAQWIYYSQELLQDRSTGSPAGADIRATVALLESLESAAADLVALHENREWRQSYPVAARSVPALQLVLVLIPGGNADAGLVLPAGRFLAEAGRRLDALTTAEDFKGHLVLLGTPMPPSAAPLPAFQFLQVSFAEKGQPFVRGHLRRYLTFYMTAALLVLAAVGLVLIYRAVAREVEVSRMKADFVSSVSHEFRTPLSAIDALLERLESGKARDEEMRQRYYRASRQEVHRLTRMVNQLLSLARLDQGREQFARETFDLNDPTGEVVRSFVDLGFGTRLVPLLDASQEHRVCADRTATYQCVHNLVDNALKYSPADSAVTVRTGRADGFAFAEVEDRGPGIPAAEQPLVFEQFYRGTGAQSGSVQGAGIGLAYVNKVMEAHGGRVTLESRPGAGSTFRLLFPETPQATNSEEARAPRP